MDWLKKIMKAIDGKKIYLLSIAGMLTLTVTFASGGIGLVEYAKAMFTLLMAMAGKSAVAKTGTPA